MQPAHFTFRPPPGADLLPPFHLDWLVQAARLSGKTLHLSVALLALTAPRGVSGTPLTRRTLSHWSISRDACYDGLRRLETAGLIRVWRLPGRAPHVILLEPGTDQPLDLGQVHRTTPARVYR
jgi:hypothetical protein